MISTNKQEAIFFAILICSIVLLVALIGYKMGGEAVVEKKVCPATSVDDKLFVINENLRGIVEDLGSIKAALNITNGGK